MERHMPEREDVVAAVREALEPEQHVLAMWEGGAAAFDRVDGWSDIDLQVMCEDGRADDVIEAARKAIEKLSPLELSFRFPEPTWHGHSQVLWRLRDTSPFLLLDFVVMQRGTERDRLLQPEIHGRAVVHFDKEEIVRSEPLNVGKLAAGLRDRIARHRALAGLIRPFVEKELRRGNAIEAMSYYQSMALRPLVELLRIKHSPLRHNFHTRYVHYEFPPDVVKRLEPLFYASDAGELGARCEKVCEWIGELLHELGDGPDERAISEAIERETART